MWNVLEILRIVDHLNEAHKNTYFLLTVAHRFRWQDEARLHHDSSFVGNHFRQRKVSRHQRFRVKLSAGCAQCEDVLELVAYVTSYAVAKKRTCKLSKRWRCDTCTAPHLKDIKFQEGKTHQGDDDSEAGLSD